MNVFSVHNISYIYMFFIQNTAVWKKITGNDESYKVFDKDARLKCENVSPTTF